MKKLLFVALSLSLLCAAGCKKQDTTSSSKTIKCSISFTAGGILESAATVSVLVDGSTVQVLSPGQKFERSFDALTKATVETVPAVTASPSGEYDYSYSLKWDFDDNGASGNKSDSSTGHLASLWSDDKARIEKALTHKFVIENGESKDLSAI